MPVRRMEIEMTDKVERLQEKMWKQDIRDELQVIRMEVASLNKWCKEGYNANSRKLRELLQKMSWMNAQIEVLQRGAGGIDMDLEEIKVGLKANKEVLTNNRDIMVEGVGTVKQGQEDDWVSRYDIKELVEISRELLTWKRSMEKEKQELKERDQIRGKRGAEASPAGERRPTKQNRAQDPEERPVEENSPSKPANNENQDKRGQHSEANRNRGEISPGRRDRGQEQRGGGQQHRNEEAMGTQKGRNGPGGRNQDQRREPNGMNTGGQQARQGHHGPDRQSREGRQRDTGHDDMRPLEPRPTDTRPVSARPMDTRLPDHRPVDRGNYYDRPRQEGNMDRRGSDRQGHQDNPHRGGYSHQGGAHHVHRNDHGRGGQSRPSKPNQHQSRQGSGVPRAQQNKDPILKTNTGKDKGVKDYDGRDHKPGLCTDWAQTGKCSFKRCKFEHIGPGGEVRSEKHTTDEKQDQVKPMEDAAPNQAMDVELESPLEQGQDPEDQAQDGGQEHEAGQEETAAEPAQGRTQPREGLVQTQATAVRNRQDRAERRVAGEIKLDNLRAQLAQMEEEAKQEARDDQTREDERLASGRVAAQAGGWQEADNTPWDQEEPEETARMDDGEEGDRRM
jgi:hypothetical protein